MSEMLNCFKSSKLIANESLELIANKYKLKNKLMIPKIKSIYLSVSAGKFFKNTADMEKIHLALSCIACQKAVFKKAKRSVAAFDVREGMKTGVLVTLRGNKMYSFLDKLKLIYLARLRDFKGLKSNSFNGRSYSFGLKDASLVFPELIANLNTYDFTFGMNVTLVFNIAVENLQKEVMESIGLPFEDSEIFK